MKNVASLYYNIKILVVISELHRHPDFQRSSNSKIGRHYKV